MNPVLALLKCMHLVVVLFLGKEHLSPFLVESSPNALAIFQDRGAGLMIVFVVEIEWFYQVPVK